MKNLREKAFTLVELVVVITIVLILGTVAFVSLQGYTKEAKDVKRTSDIRNLLSKVNIELSRGADIDNLVKDTTTITLKILGANDNNVQTFGVIDFVNLKENPSNFKDPSNNEQDYLFAYARGKSGQNSYNFLQGATISERENVTKIMGNYYTNTAGDSESLFVTGSTIFQNGKAPLIYNVGTKNDNVEYDNEQTNNKMKLGISYPPVGTAEFQASLNFLNELGVKNIIMTDTWALRETTDDNFYWTPLELRLQKFQEAGIDVLLNLENSWPAWLYSSGDHLETNTLNEFREYVSILLERYGTQISKIQYGGEINISSLSNVYGGNKDAIVKYNNILYEEVQKLSAGNRPKVVFPAFSEPTRLALDKGLISNVIIEGQEVYASMVSSYIALSSDKRVLPVIEYILEKSNYDILDMHLYDAYTAWDKYISAYLSVHNDKKGEPVPLIISEFGGPYSTDLANGGWGNPPESLLATKLPSYVEVLSDSGVEEAYFYKMVQDTSTTLTHKFSYLITNSPIEKTQSFEVFKNLVSQYK